MTFLPFISLLCVPGICYSTRCSRSDGSTRSHQVLEFSRETLRFPSLIAMLAMFMTLAFISHRHFLQLLACLGFIRLMPVILPFPFHLSEFYLFSLSSFLWIILLSIMIQFYNLWLISYTHCCIILMATLKFVLSNLNL
jgi:hypothetical protein